MLALVVTLINALASGVITGMILRMDVCGNVLEDEKFDDAVHWEPEEDPEQEILPKIRANNSRVEQVPMHHI